MNRAASNLYPVSQEQAAYAYPYLCAHAAKVLRTAKIHWPEMLAALRALDKADIHAGDKLCTLEQNFAEFLPDELDNFWRVLSAYADILERATHRGITSTDPEGMHGHDTRVANAVPCWMAQLCEDIVPAPTTIDLANLIVVDSIENLDQTLYLLPPINVAMEISIQTAIDYVQQLGAECRSNSTGHANNGRPFREALVERLNCAGFSIARPMKLFPCTKRIDGAA